VFTQAAAASIVGNLQHAVVGQHDHQHMMFADISLDADTHDADHDASHRHTDNQFHDGGAPADHGPSHHHHHGDLGSSSLLASLPSGLPLAWSQTVVPVPGRLMTDTRQHLPDRPPRTALLRV
jgi:hypothetical protein